jgi:hypothetical protein
MKHKQTARCTHDGDYKDMSPCNVTIITNVSAEPTTTLYKEGAGSPLTLVTIYQTIQRHIREDSNTTMTYLFI